MSLGVALPRVPLVITGAGAVTPLGRSLRETRDALAAGRSAIAPVETPPGVPPRADGGSPAARIGKFTTEPEMARAKARRLDLGSQYLIVASRQCLFDAHYEMAGREERTAILIGSGSAGVGPLTEFEKQLAIESPEAASPLLFPNTVANAPASQTALELKLKGPNVTITQKDPATLNALFFARLMLWDGRADAALVGSADEWNWNYHYAYERLRVTRGDTRPGYALSEGAATVLVETEASALARFATPIAVVAGIAYRTAAVSPQKRRAEPEALAATMRAALEEAGVSANAIGLVHLNRNGVPWMDEAEFVALHDVFGARDVPTAAIKLQVGENPASGAMQLALASQALRDDPSLGAVLLNGFGAGGNFAAAVLTAPAAP